MQSAPVLYLGSQSASRKQLLEWAGITYQTLSHNCDEKAIAFNGDTQAHVIAIAVEKMANLTLPEAKTIGEQIFVLTADTLIFIPSSGSVLGKPEDKTDAQAMLRLMQQEAVSVQTGCCLRVYEWSGSVWKTLHEKDWATGAHVWFDVDDHSMEWYFEKLPHALNGCGAGILEKFGQGFLRTINGSYSAVLGLPLFELRQELARMNFFEPRR